MTRYWLLVAAVLAADRRVRLDNVRSPRSAMA